MKRIDPATEEERAAVRRIAEQSGCDLETLCAHALAYARSRDAMAILRVAPALSPEMADALAIAISRRGEPAVLRALEALQQGEGSR